MCDGAGRIQHENPAFRQLITRSGEVEPIRAQVRLLARDAASNGFCTTSSSDWGSAGATRSAEFTIEDTFYRLKASPMRRAGQDYAAALVSLEACRESTLPDHFRLQHRLTPRETEVVKLLAEGHSNKSVASILGVSVHTARHHTARVLAKLQASGRAEVGAL